MKLEIRTFGGFGVTEDGGFLYQPFCGSPKSCELFAFLLANQESKISHDKLFELFWPGANYEKARQNLNSTIYLTRKCIQKYMGKVFSDHVIVNSRSMCWITLPEGVKVDFIEFEALIEKAEADPNVELKVEWLKHAVELYLGDFMTDFSSSHWVRPYQRRYLYLQINALTELQRLLIMLDRLSEATLYNEQLLLLRPLNHIGKNMRKAIDDAKGLEIELDSLKKVLLGQKEDSLAIEQENSPGFNLPGGATIVKLEDLLEKARTRADKSEEVATLILTVSGSSGLREKVMSAIQSEVAKKLRKGDLFAFTKKGAWILFGNGDPSLAENVRKRISEDESLVGLSILYSVEISFRAKVLKSSLEVDRLKVQLL